MGSSMNKIIAVVIFFVVAIGFSQGSAKEFISITGAGPSIDIVNKFISVLREDPWVDNNYQFRLDSSSTKHLGGIKNTDRNLFGRTGRPLTPEEKARGKREIFLARIPIVFVTSDSIGIDEITPDELKSIYERSIVNWSQLGGLDIPIVLIGREKTESIYLQLKQGYPFFESVRFDVVLHNDTAVVNYLKYTDKNGLAFGSAPNLVVYNLIRIKGMNLSRRVGFVFDVNNNTHPLIKAVKKIAESREWKDRLSPWGYQPISP